MLLKLSHSQQVIFWVRDLTGELPPPRTVPGMEFRLGTPADASALAAAMGPVDCPSVPERLASGRPIFLGVRDGRVLTYCWLSFRQEEVGEIEGPIRVAPDEAYVWDCQTIPEERGRGLYPVLLSGIAHAMWSAGKRRIWSGTTADNRSSQRGFEKAGFIPAGTVHYRRWLLFSSRRLELADGISPDIRDAIIRAVG